VGGFALNFLGLGNIAAIAEACDRVNLFADVLENIN